MMMGDASRRLLLLPETVYKGLLNTAATAAATTTTPTNKQGVEVNPQLSRSGGAAKSKNNIDDDEIGMKVIKARMESAKRRPPKKSSSRRRQSWQSKKGQSMPMIGRRDSENKVIYDQEFRRYLKLWNELKNRPVKVVVIPSGPKVALKSSATNTDAGGDGVKTFVINENGEFENSSGGGEEDGWHSNGYSSEHNKKLVTSSGQPLHQQQQTPSGSRMPPYISATGRMRRDRSEKIKARKSVVDKAKRDFKTYLMENKIRFPITHDGKHVHQLRSTKPIKSSTLDEIIERLVDPNTENMPSPPGTSVLGRYAYDDIYLRGLMLSRFSRNPQLTPRTIEDFLAYKTPPPPLRTHFGGLEESSSSSDEEGGGGEVQHGKGKYNHKSRHTTIRYRTFYFSIYADFPSSFKPTLWKKIMMRSRN
jgi:hypothetical protein